MPRKTNNRKNHQQPSHRHTQDYLRVYWPYLPLVLIVIAGLILGFSDPRYNKNSHSNNEVLSYATEMSISGLLSSTNVRRSDNGKSALGQSQLLTQAAQTKANDMVARDYWSHVTPDGKQPWDFIQAVGYQYLKAGENLAYGFATSDDTVTGWMNSPAHKANMLDGLFTQVGFGIANSANYQGQGPETVVVAMYAQPVVAVAPTPPPQAPPVTAPHTSQPKTAPAVTPSPPSANQQPSTPTEPIPSEVALPVESATEEAQPITSLQSEKDISQAPSKSISRVQVLTGGNAPWSASIIVGSSLIFLGLWLSHHALRIRKIIMRGERFILHHPLLDTTMIAFMGLVVLLSHNIGFIK